jgi:hypothetical protein
MTKLTKIIYSGMFLICIIGFILSLIDKNFYRAMNELALLCWVGVAFMSELRCNKLEKEINEIKK